MIISGITFSAPGNGYVLEYLLLTMKDIDFPTTDLLFQLKLIHYAIVGPFILRSSLSLIMTNEKDKNWKRGADKL